jgi:nucleotide-binding universal stress UspA family protein
MEDFPQRILVATDGSEEASLAVRRARELAARNSAELHLAHVIPVRMLYSNVDLALAGGIPRPEESREEARQLLEAEERQAEQAGRGFTATHLREGAPDAELVALAEELEVDLIVVGSRGRSGLRRALMGSVSDSVVRHAHCPVLVVRR